MMKKFQEPSINYVMPNEVGGSNQALYLHFPLLKIDQICYMGEGGS